MRSARDWRIIPVLLTALSRASRLIRVWPSFCFRPLSFPSVPSFPHISTAPRYPPSRPQRALWISFHPLVTDCRAHSSCIALSLPHPSFRPPTSLTACTTRPAPSETSARLIVRTTHRFIGDIKRREINRILVIKAT